MIVGAVLLAVESDSIWSSAGNVFHRRAWLHWVLTWVGLKLIHEAAHAIACRRLGGSVDEAGVVFVLFAPLAYVDVTNCWRMSSRWSRIGVAAAGMFAEWTVAAIAMIAWCMFQDNDLVRQWLLQTVMTAGVSTIVFNANVLMRFDGYFILADLIEVPNLASEGSAALNRFGRRWIVGLNVSPSPFSGWRCFFVPALRCGGVCVASTGLRDACNHGVGDVRGSGRVDRRRRTCRLDRTSDQETREPVVAPEIRKPRRRRPLDRRWIRHHARIGGRHLLDSDPDEYPRCRNDRLSTRMFGSQSLRRHRHADSRASDGDRVNQGDVLMSLENVDLMARQRGLEIERAQNDVRLRSAIEAHDDAARSVVQQHQESLATQIASVNTQTQSLNVVASRSGTVIARDLELKLQTYVREGDALLTIAQPSDKEITAWITQSDVDRVTPRIDEVVRVSALDGTAVDAILRRIEPQATERLPTPSLAAIHGGPLSVRTDESSNAKNFTLVEPHFKARIALDPQAAERLPTLSTLHTDIGYQNRTIAQRIQIAVRSLVNQTR